MDKLDAACISLICDKLNTCVDLDNVANLLPVWSDVVDNAKSDLLSKVDAWFEKTRGDTKKISNDDDVTDAALKAFIMSNDSTLRFINKTSQERLWIHLRCENLGFKTSSVVVKKKKHWLKDVVVTKPSDWVMDWECANKIIAPKKKVREARRSEQTVCCDECDRELGEDDALYHWSGLGPLCEECIEEDDELAGLKWETF